jgi:hypothetical protein
MDLSEDEVEALFPSDRGEDTSVDDTEHHMTVQQKANGIVIMADGQTFRLSDEDVEAMLDVCDLDSIWHAIANKFKVLEYLR